MNLTTLRARRAELIEIAARHKAEDLRVFGSVARDEATDESDVDLLVHFRDDASLFDLIGLKQDAEKLLHAEVDVLSDDAISPYLVKRILGEAVTL